MEIRALHIHTVIDLQLRMEAGAVQLVYQLLAHFGLTCVLFPPPILCPRVICFLLQRESCFVVGSGWEKGLHIEQERLILWLGSA